MADFSTLIATLQATIKTNYNQEITGQILQHDLLAIVDAVNRLKQDTLEGYAFHGAPLADGASVAVTQNTFFLVGKGTYTINGISETTGEGISALVYDSVDNEVRNYALFAYDTTPTENSRNAITSGAVFAALAPLATKEDVEAVEQEVAQVAGEAGLAEAVIDTDGAGTEQEFTFRKSGGDGGAYYRKIKGKTLAWNQLIQTVSKTLSPGDGYQLIINFDIIANHTYYIYIKASRASTESDGYQAYLDGVITAYNLFAGGTIYERTISPTSSGVQRLYLQAYSTLQSDVSFTFQLVDLSLLDSDIVAPTPAGTIANYKNIFPGIYPHNPGTLISNDADAVETTGVNQWDEEWELGSYTNTGEKYSRNDAIRSTNKIPVSPNTEYYHLQAFSGIAFYDANGNALPSDTFISNSTQGVFTTPAGACFMTFYQASATTYNHDICINLSNPAINGQYFPYWKRTLRLGITTKEDTDGNVPFPNGLQSCPVAQDEATKEGGTIRVGTRAYQAGDESDANVITDGTNTNYALATPVPFTWAEPLNLGVKVDENGTERAVAPEGATAPSAPFVADTTYTMSVARMVEKLRNL